MVSTKNNNLKKELFFFLTSMNIILVNSFNNSFFLMGKLTLVLCAFPRLLLNLSKTFSNLQLKLLEGDVLYSILNFEPWR